MIFDVTVKHLENKNNTEQSSRRKNETTTKKINGRMLDHPRNWWHLPGQMVFTQERVHNLELSMIDGRLRGFDSTLLPFNSSRQQILRISLSLSFIYFNS